MMKQKAVGGPGRNMEFEGQHFGEDAFDRVNRLALVAERNALRDAMQGLCSAADNMRECCNVLMVALGECDAPDGVFVPTAEDAQTAYSNAFARLQRATYYGNKAVKAKSGSQPRYEAIVTECEACMTEDACRIRGQCGHYLRETPNVGAERQ